MSKEKTEIQLMAEELTDLQRKVVANVVSGDYKNNVLAYFDAGGSSKDNNTARACVSEILANPSVRAYKNALLDQIAEESIISRSQAMKILSDMATTKIDDIAIYETIEHTTEDGRKIKQGVWRLKDSANLTPEQASSIMSVKATPQGIEIKQHDQKSAIKQLSEMAGWDAPKRSHITHKTPAPVKLTDDMSIEEMSRAYEDKRKQLND